MISSMSCGAVSAVGVGAVVSGAAVVGVGLSPLANVLNAMISSKVPSVWGGNGCIHSTLLCLILYGPSVVALPSVDSHFAEFARV
jgi:hypothetical protein